MMTLRPHERSTLPALAGLGPASTVRPRANPARVGGTKMIIKDLRLERGGDKARAAATVVWEESERAPFELFYETREPFVHDLTPNPHTFLVACFAPAMEHGEKRLRIDQQIDPSLRIGLTAAMELLHQWYGPGSTPLEIETLPGTPPWKPTNDKHAASFLSGGVDSLATLRGNRRDFPLDHPRAIKDCLFVHGFDIGGTEHGGREAQAYQDAWEALEIIAADAQVTLIPVRTNVRLLDDGLEFWMRKFFGAGVSSVAHAFSKRFSTVFIASSLNIPLLEPHGSHPLLDPYYSSAEMTILHDGAHLSRLQKVAIVAGWKVALDNLRVCTMNPPGMPNCGRCEKCLRTMTELLAVGKLDQTDAFPTHVVTPELLESLTIKHTAIDAIFCELISPLEAQGRHELAEVIRRKSADFHKRLRWEEERDWKGAIKKLDRKFLRGNLYKGYAALRHRSN